MATEQSEDATGEETGGYEDLIDRYERRRYLQDAAQVLSWDQQVMMPEGGTPARSKQVSALSAVTHDVITDEAFAAALEAAESADLPDARAAAVREIRREYDRAATVPRDLVERISEETSNALPIWKEAKAESDWETFAPQVETLLDRKLEYAEHVDPDSDPYEVLFGDFEPWLDLEVAERVLERLRDELVPLVDELKAADADLAQPFDGTYPDDDQMALMRATLDHVGYDFARGRIDTAPHPFSTGTQFDARVTTRFDEDDPVGAIGSTIHEFGHARYTLGLPEEHYGTPLGSHRGLTVHESQSRLWENHVGRSRAFWAEYAGIVDEHLGSDVTPQQGYEAANQIYPENRIRVEADELTYHMHIVLRFEIERDLVAGDLDVAEVPAVWNDKMEEYLGVRPETDAEGCLQDIHWSHGSFGYFPTYSLGSVLAAQLYAALEDDIPDVEDRIREGDFAPVHDWLETNVHSHGARLKTNDLVEEATGERFTADYFLEYVREKFGSLYGL